MKFRAYLLWAACVLQALALQMPAAAQGFRITPPLGPGPAARSGERAPRAADYIVAVVNSEPITNNEVRLRMSRIEQQLAQQGRAAPPRDQFAQQVLDRLISEKAQLQLAREIGIKIEDTQVDQAEQNVARQNQMDVAELQRRLAAEGLPLSQFREELRNQLLLTRLRERELESKVKISELDVDQYIRQQQQAGPDLASEALKLAYILIAVPENATEAQVADRRARAERVLQRARSGEDFGKLAAEFSDASGAAQNGGVVSLRSADRLPPLFVHAVQNLPDGGISDIVRSGAGFHVIKLLERRGGGVLPSTVLQTHARHILLRPNAQVSEAAAVKRLAEFKKRVQSGQADFAQLAREFSQDSSAHNGGDLGWANPGQFVPEFEETVNALAPGQIADPVITRFGVHLIQLLERRKATLTQQEQREIARNLLREKKLDELYGQWAQDVRGRAYVELREPPS
jgi:peptidyl-prolyl cis-trans isomerase SurA